MECWHFKDESLSPRLSLRGRTNYKLKPFHLGDCAILRKAYCLLSLLPEWLMCADFLLNWLFKCFSFVYDIICFIFVMRFSNSLDSALLGYHHNLVCLFFCEAEGSAGLKPREHFNYNHSITTLCFKVREVDCRKGSGVETHAHNNKQ